MELSYENTPIQKRIEYSVTNGLGYDSQTHFVEGRKLGRTENFCSDWLVASEEEVKDTPEGLRAHLYELNLPAIKQRDEAIRKFLSASPIYKHMRLRIGFGLFANRDKEIVQEKRAAIMVASIKNILNGHWQQNIKIQRRFYAMIEKI